MYNKKGFVQDMDKAKLLEMREAGMSNQEIADAQGCSYWPIHQMIGPQPAEITLRNRRNTALKARSAQELYRSGKQHEAECVDSKEDLVVRDEANAPRKAVLVMKPVEPAPIPLHGEFMDYVVSGDRKTVDVETEAGRVLLQIPMDLMDTFISELDAIRRNVASGQMMPFWG